MISEFVGLLAKKAKKAKNVTKGVTKNNLFHNGYKVVRRNKEQRMVRQTNTTNSAHKVYTQSWHLAELLIGVVS